jgi:hypothetical protein
MESYAPFGDRGIRQQYANDQEHHGTLGIFKKRIGSRTERRIDSN